MARTHLRFRNFRPATVEAAQAFFDAKPWREEFGSERQIELAQNLVNAVCVTYSVPTAQVELSESTYAPATYVTATVRVNSMEQIEEISPPKIHLARWSILTLLKALRTHLLANGIEQHADDPEAWAHSLFYTVKPAMFRARARENRVPGVTAKDTFSSETWEKLVNVGVADSFHETISCRPNEVNGILRQIAEGTYVAPEAPAEVPAATSSAGNESDDGWAGLFDDDDDDNLDDELEVDDIDTDDNDTEDSEVVGTAVTSAEAGETVGVQLSSDVAMTQVALYDTLSGKSIVALRRLSRGRVQGGYSMSKPDLVTALIGAGVTLADAEAA